jgi:hypothetical protein
MFHHGALEEKAERTELLKVDMLLAQNGVRIGGRPIQARGEPVPRQPEREPWFDQFPPSAPSRAPTDKTRPLRAAEHRWVV